MNNDCIENLRVLAAINHNSVSEQNLKLLGEKYSLSEAELQELDQYCKDNGIDVYDEEKMACISGENNNGNNVTCSVRKTDCITEEEKENQKMASIITKRIMHIAAIKARKSVNGRGWLCGTYTGSVRRLVEQRVRRSFSNEELKYIVDHLSDSDEEDLFAIEDQQSPGTCDILNDKLNELIPRLHINRFYSDIFED